MAEVAEVVRRGAADVHLHDPRSQGHERILPPRARVVQSKRHDGCERGHRARAIKALARGRRSSFSETQSRDPTKSICREPMCTTPRADRSAEDRRLRKAEAVGSNPTRSTPSCKNRWKSGVVIYEKLTSPRRKIRVRTPG